MTQARPQAPSSEAPEATVSRGVSAKRLLIIVAVLVGALLITAFTGYLILNAINGTRHEATATASGVTVAPLVTVPGDSAYPIGLARGSDGTLYLSTFGSGVIYKLAVTGSTGTLTPWVQTMPNTSGNIDGITAPAALAIAPDGRVIVIDFNSSKPGTAVGVLKQITPDGQVRPFGGGASNAQTSSSLSFLSHLAFDNVGNLYVTFTATSEVWRFTPAGVGAPWLKLSTPTNQSTAAQPTGVTFDAADKSMIVADAASGTIYRVAITSDGQAGPPLVLYRQAGLAVQSVTYDAGGHLLLTAWLHDDGQFARLEANGTYTLLAQSFREPSDALLVGTQAYIVNSDLLGLTPLLHPNPPFTVDVVTLPATSP